MTSSTHVELYDVTARKQASVPALAVRICRAYEYSLTSSSFYRYLLTQSVNIILFTVQYEMIELMT